MEKVSRPSKAVPPSWRRTRSFARKTNQSRTVAQRLLTALTSVMATYRSPRIFADLELLDLLELTGSSVNTAPLLHMSQPTVSRRRRKLQQDLDLMPGSNLREGDGPCLRLLRRAAKRHRLDAGIWRLGGDGWCFDPVVGAGQVLTSQPRFAALRHWRALVEGHVLDGAVVSGHELRLAMPSLPGVPAEDGQPVAWQNCIAVPLLQMPLRLLSRAGQPRGRPTVVPWSRVIMPPLSCCAGLATALRQQQLRPVHLKPAPTPRKAWLRALDQDAALALATPLWQQQLQACEPVPLQEHPLPQPLTLELWLLVHRRDWSKQPEIAKLARTWAELVMKCIGMA